MDAIERAIAAAKAVKAGALDHETKETAKLSGFSVVLVGAMREAWRRFKARLGITANMNTQEAAEATQAAMREGLPEFLLSGEVFVEWRSLLDGKERPTHNAAHGQRAKLPGGVFTVGGASLRFPGDSGLGAPLSETESCRCFLRTIWVKPDGTEEIIEDGLLNPSSPARRMRRPGDNRNAFTRTKPTPSFTFGYGKGPWRGKVVLHNGDVGNYTVGNGAITIRVGGKPVASAPLQRDAFGKFTLGRVTANQSYNQPDIERLMSASVEASNRLPRVQP